MKYVKTENGIEKMQDEDFEAMQEENFNKIKENIIADGQDTAGIYDLNTVAEYVKNRRLAYGTVAEQLEFITENGLAAWQKKVKDIKAMYPKVSVDSSSATVDSKPVSLDTVDKTGKSTNK